jgi:hypothetical protein
MRHFAARRRAVNPTERTQSATASSKLSNVRMRSMIGPALCAIPSRRYGSYGTGRTRRSASTPMFCIARAVAAMLTWSCGS